MSDSLDDLVSAYSDDADFSFDNKLILNWYPGRIISLTDKGSSVLELGIGHGYTSKKFSEYYRDYTVIDGSETIIEKFRLQYPASNVKITHSYFENYSTNKKFDLIIMGFVLEHVDDPSFILNKFKKYLTNNGRCFVCVPNAESLHRRFGHEAGLLPDMAELSDSDLAFGHQRQYTLASLVDQLQHCGYQVVKKEGIFLKSLTTYQLESLNLSHEILEGMCIVGVDYPELSAGLLIEARIIK